MAQVTSPKPFAARCQPLLHRWPSWISTGVLHQEPFLVTRGHYPSNMSSLRRVQPRFDPEETDEWLESLESVLHTHGGPPKEMPPWS